MKTREEVAVEIYVIVARHVAEKCARIVDSNEDVHGISASNARAIREFYQLPTRTTPGLETD